MVCALSLMLLDLGNRIASQIRVQNDADSAVAAMIAVQAQDYNRMTMIVYAMAVEETRIRQLADGIYLSARQIGTCVPDSFAASGCPGVYAALQPRYIQAVNRYATLVQLLHDSTYRSTFASQSSDADLLLSLLTDAQHCNTPSGLDCQMNLTYKYAPSLPGYQYGGPAAVPLTYTAGIESYFQSSIWNGDSSMPTSGIFEPARVQITACAKVQPLVSRFLDLQLAPYTVAATSAATTGNISVEEESPGVVTITSTGLPMQPMDQIVPSPLSDPSGLHANQDDMYNPVFRAQIGNGLGFGGQSDQTDWARKGIRIDAVWWGPILIHPYAPAPVCP